MTDNKGSKKRPIKDLIEKGVRGPKDRNPSPKPIKDKGIPRPVKKPKGKE